MLLSKSYLKQRISIPSNVSVRRTPVVRNIQVKATVHPLVDVIVAVIAIGVIGDVASTFYRHSKHDKEEKEKNVKVTIMSPLKQNKKELKDDFDM